MKSYHQMICAYKGNMSYKAANIRLFVFSSRRRHTRWNCDWSSDVCSSDLGRPAGADRVAVALEVALQPLVAGVDAAVVRSEERRVGKECRSGWSTFHYKKKSNKFMHSMHLDISSIGVNTFNDAHNHPVLVI